MRNKLEIYALTDCVGEVGCAYLDEGRADEVVEESYGTKIPILLFGINENFLSQLQRLIIGAKNRGVSVDVMYPDVCLMIQHLDKNLR